MKFKGFMYHMYRTTQVLPKDDPILPIALWYYLILHWSILTRTQALCVRTVQVQYSVHEIRHVHPRHKLDRCTILLKETIKVSLRDPLFSIYNRSL